MQAPRPSPCCRPGRSPLAEPLQVTGTPREFDAFLRPPLRAVQLAVGLIGTLAVLWFGQWWWVPAPLAASFLIYEWFFWARGDRAIRLDFDADAMREADTFLKRHRTVRWEAISSATLVYRDKDDHKIEAIVVLCTDDEVVLGLQFMLPASEFVAGPTDVDADLCNAVIGAISGLIRALAPREVLVRQQIEDPAALQWLRQRFDERVWANSSVRQWTGAAPELDLFGYYAQPHDGLLHLEGPTARWVGRSESAESIPSEPGPPCQSRRTAILFRMSGEEHEEKEEPLPLWLQPVGGQVVAIPAPIASLHETLPSRDPDPDWRHVHAPEGAVVLWHLWQNTPAEAWPSGWKDALRAARPVVPRCPQWLEDHL